MGNMGYCRFRNTLLDLQDCDEHLWDDDLSSDEKRARLHLIKLCYEIAADTEGEEEDF